MQHFPIDQAARPRVTVHSIGILARSSPRVLTSDRTLQAARLIRGVAERATEVVGFHIDATSGLAGEV